MSRSYTLMDERRIVLLRQEHATTARINSGIYSFSSLFSDDTLHIEDYCHYFRPNYNAMDSDPEVKAFAQHYDIWIEETGDEYNSMTAYLHSTPGLERLNVIGKIYAVLFYMNDTIGREKMGRMNDGQKYEVRQLVDRLNYLVETGNLSPDAGPIERAARKVLLELKNTSDPAWYEQFLTLTKLSLNPSFVDQNGRAQGHVLSIEEYADLRLHISGMYLTVALFEYGEDLYLDWDELRRVGLDADVARMQWLCAAIGALMNDMYSFEKEFIVDGADFNLLPIVILNQPNLTLGQGVHKAATIVRDMVKEFRDLDEKLLAVNEILRDTHPGLAQALDAHLRCLRASVQATYVWEKVTARYKQQASIFRENLANNPPASV